MSRLNILVPEQPGPNTVNYLNALSHLGAAGVASDRTDAAGYAGLLLPGGWDADPGLYGQANVACRHVDRALDDLQLRALDAFLAEGKPVLGICRGLQLMNLYFGGTLAQDLPTARAHGRGAAGDNSHETTAEKGSFLEKLYGPRFTVNSSHHQGIEIPGKGLRVSQRADDGVIEGIEHETLPLWGVQWHPERMCFEHARADTVDGSIVIQMFLSECQRRL